MVIGGSTWMKNLLARIPGYYTRPEPMPKEVAENQDIADSAFSCLPKHGYALFKTHLNPTPENINCIFRNGVQKVLVVYRDLRDVAISLCHRETEFYNPNNKFNYVDYKAIGKSTMDYSIEYVANVFVPWIRGWIAVARENPQQFHFTKFEELKTDTKAAFKKVLHFYGIELSDKKVGRIVEAARGKKNVKVNMEAAKVLPWGYSSNFRSGKMGQWKDELSKDQIEKCRILLGPALIELGYEKDLNW